MTSMQLVKDPEGQSYIPPSQRPDGTWRKSIRVRDGYVPQEEQPVYVSKGRQSTTGERSEEYPVGLSPSDFESFKSGGGGGFSVGYFDIGNYTPKAPIPGLNFVESSIEAHPAGGKSKSKKSKNKGGGKSEDGGGANSTIFAASQGKVSNATSVSSNSKLSTSSSTSVAAAPSSVSQQIDPAKRLRNLKKRLKEIEELEKKIMSGDLPNPEKEQLEKLKRKEEVQEDIDELEKTIAKLNIS